jgi:hypothetical protein
LTAPVHSRDPTLISRDPTLIPRDPTLIPPLNSACVDARRVFTAIIEEAIPGGQAA